MQRRLIVIGLTAAIHWPAGAQLSTQREEPLRDHTPRVHALIGATLHIAPGKVIANGVLVLKDGRVAAAGPAASTPVPKGARVWKLDGKSVYAGFIDLASSVGLPANARARAAALPFSPGGPPSTPQRAEDMKAPGPRGLSSSNRSVRADFDVAANLEFRADEVKAARELGFTSVLAAPQAGILRGQSALLNTADRPDTKSLVVAPRVAQHAANEAERGFTGSQYPNSMMGAIALLRQSMLDARWHRGALEAYRANPSLERPEPNATLEALTPVLLGRQPVIYAADGEQDFQRIGKVRDEFGLNVIAQGNGYEYRRRDHLKSLAMPVIVPVNFPAPPEVETPDQALDVQLEQLQHWEQAPSNPSLLASAGIEFALTAHGMTQPSREFWNNVRLAVRRGLTADRALAALTTTPAKLIGLQRQLGTLEPGRIANVVVASADLFATEGAEVELAFVDGRPHPTTAAERIDVRGTWRVGDAQWSIGGTKLQPALTIDGAACDIAMRGRQMVVSIPCKKDAAARSTIVAELIADTLTGSLEGATAAPVPWRATRIAAFRDSARPATADVLPAPAAVYPAGTYGIAPPARPAAVLVKNATLWTSGPAGKLAKADLLVRDGRISAVGKSLSAPGAIEIDATGKHVTPGLIDAHSHTAANGGLNESTSSVSAEVRVADVLDATAISMYRQLAGGTTAANVMHGSANTIGGQTQTVKFRWGLDAEGLKVQGALPGIKFALGENVKQSNAATETTRYPQTRMGVEQVIRDAFSAAKGYQRQWADWRATPKTPGAVVAEPRRDLQLEALVELLEKKRAVHIHSYRADEILMFARVAKELGIPVATFQHVLEGYKVADAIRDIGAGGSSFSDWWAYKMEVWDAIPWNGAIMHNAGVLTTFNSDSDELARRLNTEAAKAVRYGNVPESEALKFVTLNAAKQLGIDKQTGSLETGKDADFVIWSADPLSPLARAEQTWIDGRKYFDLKDDARMQDEAAKEKARLVAKALPARLARLRASTVAGSGGRGAGPAAPEAPPSDVRTLLAYFAAQRALHQLNHVRGEYWNGGEWLECTGEGR
ncbi:MAG: amidohydrolase family protein [Betaproteobacteria bacterium]|nr:amidohydrolase family protein [Betaproteobacteria bacterium]